MSHITKSNIEECLKRAIESIKRNADKPDMYFTRCKTCGRLVLAPAYMPVEKCPICEQKEVND